MLKHYNNKIIINQPVPLSIDLGCGAFKRPDFIGIDWADFGQEIVWDVRNGLPLLNDWVQHLYTSHFLEHCDATTYHLLINEFMRVIKHNGILEIVVPYGDTWQGHLACHYLKFNENDMTAIHEYYPKPKPTFNMVECYRDGIHLKAKFIVIKN